MDLDKEQYAWLADPDVLDTANELSYKLTGELLRSIDRLNPYTQGELMTAVLFNFARGVIYGLTCSGHDDKVPRVLKELRYYAKFFHKMAHRQNEATR